MPGWGIGIIVTGCVLLYFGLLFLFDWFHCKKAETVLMFPMLVVGCALMFPVVLIGTVWQTVTDFKPRKAFRFLEEEGFLFSKKKGEYRWARENICIRICIREKAYNYEICLDYQTETPAFQPFYDSNIGTQSERENLLSAVNAYKNADSRAIMDREVDVDFPHLQFIKNNLSLILSYIDPKEYSDGRENTVQKE